MDSGSNAQVVGYFAPLNFYTGFRMTDGQQTGLANTQDIVSGSDASYNSIFMSTNMQIRMNPAVRIRGNYYIGSWMFDNFDGTAGDQHVVGLPVNPEYLNMQAHGVQRSFSPGYWRTLWLTAQLPWGEIAVGKRPSSWGMGLSFDGADNRSSESLALSAPFGPVKVQLSFYPSRRASNTAYYNNNYDKNNTRVFDMTIPNITYTNGPLEVGVIATWVNSHRGGEEQLTAPATRITATTAGTVGRYNDYAQWYGSAFVKYNNGRFFLNSEIQTDQTTIRFLKGSDGASLAATNGVFQAVVNGPTYVEHWGGAIEAGVLAGPSKISVLGAWFTGNDTRVTTAGQRRLITQGVQGDTWSNVSVFKPYSYLMAYSYGMGNTAPVADTREGYVTDASVYAARLDYAVAANLNLFGSFAWAERFSKSGYTWGFVYPNTTATTGGWVARANSTVAFAPSIPDTALGWEIDAGADWKLLESLNLRTTFAYWQPGKWFNFAYQDKSLPGWGTNAAGASWGNNWLTRPDRTIDGIWGLDIKLEGTF